MLLEASPAGSKEGGRQEGRAGARRTWKGRGRKSACLARGRDARAVRAGTAGRGGRLGKGKERRREGGKEDGTKEVRAAEQCTDIKSSYMSG